MIKVEVTSGSNTLETIIANLQNNFPLSKISKAVQEDIQDEATRRGWKRIPATIKRGVLDKNNHVIFLGGKEKDKDVAVYLNDGTEDHSILPKNKKALRWVSGGQTFFSKHNFVKGIKTTHFFTIYDSTLNKINAIVIEALKTA